MHKQESGYRANIGSSSLILIFIVMCLVTFGMLSLSAAKSDLNLARRNAEAVTEYYRADSEGEAFYAMVSMAVQDACKEAQDETSRERILETALAQYYTGVTSQGTNAGGTYQGLAGTEVSMARAQALRIQLTVDLTGAGSVGVNQWKVIQTEDYEIDNSMPVWTGN